MEKEFVPYELALRMKQLGFNEPCLARWQKNKKLQYRKENDWIYNFDPNPDNLEFYVKNHPNYLMLINGKYLWPQCVNFTASLFQQAFRWFREKYNIHIRIEKYDETKWWANWGSWTSEVYDSYEETEVACIEKLIEIVEQKN
jgi:hypothetical protein